MRLRTVEANEGNFVFYVQVDPDEMLVDDLINIKNTIDPDITTIDISEYKGGYELRITVEDVTANTRIPPKKLQEMLTLLMGEGNE